MAAPLETQQTTSTAFPQPPLQSWKRISDQTAVRANHSLEAYAPINLAEMKAVTLLKRVDTKYILPVRQLFQAIREPQRSIPGAGSTGQPHQPLSQPVFRHTGF